MSESPVAVQVFSKVGCKPCAYLKPFLSEMKEDYHHYQWRDIDVDLESIASQRANVQSVPCVVVYKNGREIGRHVGTQNLTVLLGLLKKAETA